MRVTVRRDHEWLVLGFRRETGDRHVARKVEFTGVEARIEVRSDTAIHSDLVALAALLCAQPWAASLTMPSPISPTFADAVRAGLGVDIGPVDSSVMPRQVPDHGRPGLAYSGGVDCTAALTVLPDATAAYFLERIVPPGGVWVGAYRLDAALHACTELAATGRHVRRVRSDLEFLRTPYGFPHDLANAIPAIVHADVDRLDSIGWGAILESTYQVGSTTFRDYANSPFVRGFGPAFTAAGLPIVNAVAGVSEVGTAIIAQRSPYGRFAQSCMRGTVGEPCRRCWKCARKILLDSALTGSWPPQSEIVRMLTRRNTPGYLRKEPLKHEGVVAFLAARYPRRDPNDLLSLLAERVGGYDVEWLTRWYPASLATAPETYRDAIAQNLDRYLHRMTADDAAALTSWDLRPVLAQEARQRATTAFLTALEHRLPASKRQPA